MRYVSFIHRDEAGYGISFPDFPGCVAVAETADAVVREGREALAFHVEGLWADGDSIPPPRSIEAVKGDPDLADWRRNADLVLIPLLINRGSGGIRTGIGNEAQPRPKTRPVFPATTTRREIEGT
jgi:predicted RNase H-like HicB family nuclease